MNYIYEIFIDTYWQFYYKIVSELFLIFISFLINVSILILQKHCRRLECIFKFYYIFQTWFIAILKVMTPMSIFKLSIN